MNLASQAEWDAFVEAHPDATLFHLSAWATVIGRTFGHPVYLLAERREGKLVAVLPLVEVRTRLFGHALISTAFCVGGGPLANDPAALDAILDAAEALGQRLKVEYVELRDTPVATDGWTPRDQTYASFARALPADEAENLAAIPRRQRAVLRKTLARDWTLTADAGVDDFYPLYARSMRDHGTPALPRRYFEEVIAALGPMCEVLTARLEGRAISSVVTYTFRGRVMPYYVGSGPEARRLGANDLLYWSLMRRGAARGCTVFDFGRSKVGTGPYHFKHNWGFEARPIVNQFRLLKARELRELNPTNPSYRLLIAGWRRLPLLVATAVSPLLSRGLG